VQQLSLLAPQLVSPGPLVWQLVAIGVDAASPESVLVSGPASLSRLESPPPSKAESALESTLFPELLPESKPESIALLPELGPVLVSESVPASTPVLPEPLPELLPELPVSDPNPEPLPDEEVLSAPPSSVAPPPLELEQAAKGPMVTASAAILNNSVEFIAPSNPAFALAGFRKACHATRGKG
jgi:hypothetical protein